MQVQVVKMVRGPATVHVNGLCRLLGMDVSGKVVQARAGKALPFELGPGCTLAVEGGDAWNADPLEAGTAIWESLVMQIFGISDKHGGAVVVMFVGASDAGKSTLLTYLVNTAISRGLFPCVIDGDIGQGDLGPPAAIGAALPCKQVIDLRDISADYFEFVGSVTPAGLERLVAVRIKSLLSRTKRLSRLHLINTDGYVADGGIAYKEMLARALAPNILICLGCSDELASALARGPWLFLPASSSNQAVKTPLDRIGRRMDQFVHYLGEGLTSARPGKTRFEYRGRRISLSRAVRIFAPTTIEGLFVGLGLHGAVIGFGVIESVKDEKMQIKTDIRHFDTVYFSNIILKGGRERRLLH